MRPFVPLLFWPARPVAAEFAFAVVLPADGLIPALAVAVAELLVEHVRSVVAEFTFVVAVALLAMHAQVVVLVIFLIVVAQQWEPE